MFALTGIAAEKLTSDEKAELYTLLQSPNLDSFGQCISKLYSSQDWYVSAMIESIYEKSCKNLCPAEATLIEDGVKSIFANKIRIDSEVLLIECLIENSLLPDVANPEIFSYMLNFKEPLRSQLLKQFASKCIPSSSNFDVVLGYFGQLYKSATRVLDDSVQEYRTRPGCEWLSTTAVVLSCSDNFGSKYQSTQQWQNIREAIQLERESLLPEQLAMVASSLATDPYSAGAFYSAPETPDSMKELLNENLAMYRDQEIHDAFHQAIREKQFTYVKCILDMHPEASEWLGEVVEELIEELVEDDVIGGIDFAVCAQIFAILDQNGFIDGDLSESLEPKILQSASVDFSLLWMMRTGSNNRGHTRTAGLNVKQASPACLSAISSFKATRGVSRQERHSIHSFVLNRCSFGQSQNSALFRVEDIKSLIQARIRIRPKYFADVSAPEADLITHVEGLQQLTMKPSIVLDALEIPEICEAASQGVQIDETILTKAILNTPPPIKRRI